MPGGIPSGGDPAYLTPHLFSVIGAGLADLNNRTEEVVRPILQALVTGNINLTTLSDQVFDGINAAGGIVAGILEAVLVNLFGAIPGFDGVEDIKNAMNLWRDNFALFTASINFFSPSFDIIDAATGFLNTVLLPLNLIAQLIDGFVPEINIPNLDASILTHGLLDPLRAPWAATVDFVNGIIATLSSMLTGSAGTVAQLGTWFLSSILGPISPGRIPSVSASSIATISPNLLNNGGFDSSVSVDENPEWEWTDADGHNALGCVYTVADGSHRVLMSNMIPVAAGESCNTSVWVKWDSIVGVGIDSVLINVSEYGPGNSLLNVRNVGGFNNVSGSHTWQQVPYTYTVPGGVDKVTLTLEVLATSGTVYFDDASFTKTQLIPQSFVFGLPTDLSALGTLIQNVINKFWEMVTGLVAGVPKSLTDVGAALAALPQTSLAAFGTAMTAVSTNLSAIVTNIQNAFAGAAAVGNAVADNVHTQVVGFLGSIQTGLTGAINAGVQTTQAVVQGTLNNIAQAVASANQAIADLVSRFLPAPAATVVGGPAPAIPIPTSWGSDWQVSGTASASATVTSDGYHLVDSGSSPRVLKGMNLESSIDSDYQSIRFLLNTLMETPLAGGSANAGNSLTFRADSVTNPLNYGELRFYYNQIKLISVAAGTPTVLKTWAIAPSRGVTYSLDCGTASGPTYYQLYANGLPVDVEFHDSGPAIHYGPGYRENGQFMYTDTRGATESSPGAVGYWKCSDKTPGQKLGSGFRCCRTSTSLASFSAGADLFPANFYDHFDGTPDYSFSASTSTVTVKDEGWYTFTIGLPFLATNGTYNIYGGVSVALAVDGDLVVFGGPPGNAVAAVVAINYSGIGGSAIGDTKAVVGPTGVWWTTPPVYCEAESEVAPVYASAAPLSIAGGYGLQTVYEQATQYFGGAKLGQVVV